VADSLSGSYPDNPTLGSRALDRPLRLYVHALGYGYGMTTLNTGLKLGAGNMFFWN